MDDGKVRDIIKDLRTELGYDRPPPSEVQYPEWLTAFLGGLAEGIFAILNWIAAGGWRILIPVLVVIKPEGELANREIRRKIPRDWQSPFENLYLAAERILFDNADGTPDDFDRLAAVYREGFR